MEPLYIIVYSTHSTGKTIWVSLLLLYHRLHWVPLLGFCHTQFTNSWHNRHVTYRTQHVSSAIWLVSRIPHKQPSKELGKPDTILWVSECMTLCLLYTGGMDIPLPHQLNRCMTLCLLYTRNWVHLYRHQLTRCLTLCLLYTRNWVYLWKLGISLLPSAH